MSIQVADYLVHFSNILLLIAYSVRDILWLRWFAVAAALTNIPYYLVRPERLWPPVVWGIVFMTINLVQIVLIYMERRPVSLSDDERSLYDLGFRSLRPREFLSLVLVGEWKDASAGETLLSEGTRVSSVSIPISGSVRVRTGGRDLADLEPGRIIGTGLALTGEPSPVDATFTRPARYITWPLHSLRQFLDRRPDLRIALQGLVNHDLAHKLDALLDRDVGWRREAGPEHGGDAR